MPEVTREGVIISDGPMPEMGMMIRVRKPREDARSLSFMLPTKDMYLQSLLVRDVLDMGLAFDGDAVFVEVTPHTRVSKWEPNSGTPEENAATTLRSCFYEAHYADDGPRSLSMSLNTAQRELADWLIRVCLKAGWKVNVYFV